MSYIRVPSDYTTISEAIAAAVGGDVILIAEGTYPEALDLTASFSDLVIRAEQGATVIISSPAAISGGTYSAHVLLDGISRVRFRDLIFAPTENTSADMIIGYSDTECTSIQLIDCSIYSNDTTGGTNNMLSYVRLGFGSPSLPTVVRRCYFGNNAGDSARPEQVLSIYGGAAEGVAIIENNRFYAVELDETPTVYSVSTYIGVDHSASDGLYNYVLVRNNTLDSVLTDRYVIHVDIGAVATDAVYVYNNLIELNSGDTPSSYAGMITIANAGSLSSAVCSNNLIYRSGGGPSSSSFAPNSGNNITSDPWTTIFDEVYSDSPAYREGRPFVASERPVRIDVAGLSHHDTLPSIGDRVGIVTRATSPDMQMLYARYVNIDPVDGLEVSIGGTPLVFSSSLRGDFAHPIDLAKGIELRIGDAFPEADIEFWYDLDDRVYKMAYRGSEVSVTLSGFAAYLLGAVTATSKYSYRTFGGASDYASASTNVAARTIFPGGSIGTFTVLMWAKQDTSNGFHFWSCGTNFNDIVQSNAAGRDAQDLSLEDGGVQQTTGLYAAMPASDAWGMYAVTHAAGTISVYADGVETINETGIGGTYTAQDALVLFASGGTVPGVATGETGSLRNIAIFDRALTADEIAALYHGGPEHRYDQPTVDALSGMGVEDWVGETPKIWWHLADVAGAVPNSGTGGTCNLVFSGDVATVDESSLITFGADPQALYMSHYVHMEPVNFTWSGTSSRLGSGRFVGDIIDQTTIEALSSANDTTHIRRGYRISGLSTQEDLIPGGPEHGEATPDSSIRRTVEMLLAGGRGVLYMFDPPFYLVYVWSITTGQRYDRYAYALPVVVRDVADSNNFAWGNNVMTRTEFVLDVLEDRIDV